MVEWSSLVAHLQAENQRIGVGRATINGQEIQLLSLLG